MRPAMASAEISSPEFADGCSDILNVDFVSTEVFSLRILFSAQVGTRCARFDLTYFLVSRRQDITQPSVADISYWSELHSIDAAFLSYGPSLLAEFGTVQISFKSWAGSNFVEKVARVVLPFRKTV